MTLTPRRCLVVLVPVLALLLTPAASAATPTKKPPTGGSVTWSVQPANSAGPSKRTTFSWTNVKPRTVIHDYVAITNYSQAAVTFQVYATDAVTTSSGSLDLLPHDKLPTDVGAWATFEHSSVTVPARGRVIEPLTLTVPQNATPGDHTGGVVGAVSERAKASNGQPVVVDRRIGVPIHLRVAGGLHPVLTVDSVSSGFHGTLNPFGSGGTNVAYTVHNAGNVRLSGAQTVSVTGPFGTTLATVHPSALPSLLPGESVRVTAHLSGVFPAGPLTVHIKVTPSSGAGVPTLTAAVQPVSRSVGLWATPLAQLLSLVVIVLVGVGAWWLLRWRRRTRQAALAAATEAGRKQAAVELGSRSPQHSAPETS